jgi:hypothetical protein
MLHIYTQTTHNTENGTYITIKNWNIHKNKNKLKLLLGNAGRAPSLEVIPWHLPYK